MWHHRSVLKPGRHLQQAIMNIADVRKRPRHGSALRLFYTCGITHKKEILEPVKPKVIITSAKEVMFSPVSDCWCVALSEGLHKSYRVIFKNSLRLSLTSRDIFVPPFVLLSFLRD